MSAINTRESKHRAIEKALGYAKGDVIAVKIWTKGDIESVLEDEFYIEEPDPKLVSKIGRSDMIKCLEDCLDEEWETISMCCGDVLARKEN